MKKYAKAMRPGLAYLAVALLSLAPGIAAIESTQDSEEVSGYLAQAKTKAMQLQQDAQEMNNFVRSKMSWETHASKIEEIKQHVNNLAELVAKMNHAKATASPWQRQSLRQITPLLEGLAASVTPTIRLLNQNQDRLQVAPYSYRDFVAANSDLAADMAQLVSDYVAYGEAKHKSEQLSRKLELPPS